MAAAREVQLTSVELTLIGETDVRGALGVDDEPRNGFERIGVSFRVTGNAPVALAEKLSQEISVPVELEGSASHVLNIERRFQVALAYRADRRARVCLLAAPDRAGRSRLAAAISERGQYLTRPRHGSHAHRVRLADRRPQHERDVDVVGPSGRP